MRHELAHILDDLAVRAQLARLEHADRHRPLAAHRGPSTLGGMASAIAEARGLDLAQGTAPAAVFFAFGRRPYLFPEAHRSMTFLLTAAEAQQIGRRLAIVDEQLERMLERLLSEHPPSFTRLRDWLTPRLMPRRAGDDERLPRQVR